MTLLTVNEFRGSYRFLSTFCPQAVMFEGVRYNTVEHAFRASMFMSRTIRQMIKDCHKPGDAKRMSRMDSNIPYLNPNFDNIKLQVMEELLRQKFSPNSMLAEKLLATMNAKLVDGNNWGDKFWGVDIVSNEGLNHHGKILMKIREDLKQLKKNKYTGYTWYGVNNHITETSNTY